MDPEEEEHVEEDPVAIEVAAFGEFLDESEDDEEIPEKVLEPCSARPWPNCVLYLAGEPWVNPVAEGSGLWPSTGLSMPTNPPFFGLLCDTVYTMPDGLRELVRPLGVPSGQTGPIGGGVHVERVAVGPLWRHIYRVDFYRKRFHHAKSSGNSRHLVTPIEVA